MRAGRRARQAAGRCANSTSLQSLTSTSLRSCLRINANDVRERYSRGFPYPPPPTSLHARAISFVQIYKNNSVYYICGIYRGLYIDIAALSEREASHTGRHTHALCDAGNVCKVHSRSAHKALARIGASGDWTLESFFLSLWSFRVTK